MAKVTNSAPSVTSAPDMSHVPDGWATVDINRYKWSIRDCATPLRGYVADLQELPTGKGDEDEGDSSYLALVVYTTAPTEAKADDGTIVTVPKGTWVIVSESTGLKPILSQLHGFAQNGSHVHEILLMRSHQVKTPKGQMWKIKSPFAYNPNPISRDQLPPVPQFGAAPESDDFEPAKLAAQNGTPAFPAT